MRRINPKGDKPTFYTDTENPFRRLIQHIEKLGWKNTTADILDAASRVTPNVHSMPVGGGISFGNPETGKRYFILGVSALVDENANWELS
jgi:hypothetical protein